MKQLRFKRGAVVPVVLSFLVGAVPAHALYDASDDLLDPARGFRAGLRISPEYSVIDGGGSATEREHHSVIGQKVSQVGSAPVSLSLFVGMQR